MLQGVKYVFPILCTENLLRIITFLTIVIIVDLEINLMDSNCHVISSQAVEI